MSSIAVVTGAGRGLGRKIAERLAGRYQVLVTDIDHAAALGTAGELGNGAWALAHDVRDPHAHEAVARAARERGELAVWVNNAGVLAVGDAWQMGSEDVRRIVEDNLLGVNRG
jgi:NAD(P)-dependent dehydrogenase (short-subunit alcohol dehydrogenase family)